jgi:predicted transcriptional regulator YdeE
MLLNTRTETDRYQPVVLSTLRVKLSLTIALQGDGAMDIQHHVGFYIAGLTARTNNAREMSGKGKIDNVWHAFLQPELVAKIPNKVGVDLIAVYTDYEAGHTGYYTYLLGLPVLSVESLPACLTVKHITAGRYAVFSSGRGPITEIVPKIWQRIWSMSPKELGGRRAFKTDYEIYDQRSADPEYAQIDVYIGLR